MCTHLVNGTLYIEKSSSAPPSIIFYNNLLCHIYDVHIDSGEVWQCIHMDIYTYIYIGCLANISSAVTT